MAVVAVAGPLAHLLEARGRLPARQVEEEGLVVATGPTIVRGSAAVTEDGSVLATTTTVTPITGPAAAHRTAEPAGAGTEMIGRGNVTDIATMT